MAKHKENKKYRKKKHSEKVLPEHTVATRDTEKTSHVSDTETSHASDTSRDTSRDASRVTSRDTSSRDTSSRDTSRESRDDYIPSHPTSHKRQRTSTASTSSGEHLVNANEPMASTSSNANKPMANANEPMASTSSGKHLVNANEWKPGDPLQVAVIPSVVKQPKASSPPSLSHLILTRDDAKILQPTVTFNNFVLDTVRASKTFLYVTHTRYFFPLLKMLLN